MTNITTNIETNTQRAGTVIVIDPQRDTDAASTALAIAAGATNGQIVATFKEHVMHMQPSALYGLSHPQLVKFPLAALANLEHDDAGELLKAICRFHNAGALIIDAMQWRQAITANECAAVAGMRNLKSVAGELAIPVVVLSDAPILQLLTAA